VSIARLDTLSGTSENEDVPVGYPMCKAFAINAQRGATPRYTPAKLPSNKDPLTPGTEGILAHRRMWQLIQSCQAGGSWRKRFTPLLRRYRDALGVGPICALSGAPRSDRSGEALSGVLLLKIPRNQTRSHVERKTFPNSLGFTVGRDGGCKVSADEC
jgi:hypothetical protein